jgi:hypothetical protein
MLEFFMRAIITAAALMLIFYAVPASSDVFKYVDENGVACYTDAPAGKKTVRIIREQKGIAKTVKADDGTTSSVTSSVTGQDYSGEV